MKFKTIYSKQADFLYPTIECAPGSSLTKQEFKEDCDMNNILKKYNKTGLLPDMIKNNPQFGDFSSTTTYQEALNICLHAQTQFENLPSTVRDRFGNDPAGFLSFAEDPRNAPELIKMGLATAKPIEAPTPLVEPSEPKPKKDPNAG